MTAMNLTDDAHCFVCGKSNVDGLQLEWKTEGNTTEAEFFPQRAHQGWRGLVHGGILATVMDEAMTRRAWEKFGGAVTGELTIRYLRPARVGERLVIRGEVLESKSRIIPAKAEIRSGDGRIVATATGKAFRIAKPAEILGDAPGTNETTTC